MTISTFDISLSLLLLPPILDSYIFGSLLILVALCTLYLEIFSTFGYSLLSKMRVTAVGPVTPIPYFLLLEGRCLIYLYFSIIWAVNICVLSVTKLNILCFVYRLTLKFENQ